MEFMFNKANVDEINKAVNTEDSSRAIILF